MSVGAIVSVEGLNNESNTFYILQRMLLLLISHCMAHLPVEWKNRVVAWSDDTDRRTFTGGYAVFSLASESTFRINVIKVELQVKLYILETYVNLSSCSNDVIAKR